MFKTDEEMVRANITELAVETMHDLAHEILGKDIITFKVTCSIPDREWDVNPIMRNYEFDIGKGSVEGNGRSRDGYFHNVFNLGYDYRGLFEYPLAKELYFTFGKTLEEYDLSGIEVSWIEGLNDEGEIHFRLIRYGYFYILYKTFGEVKASRQFDTLSREFLRARSEISKYRGFGSVPLAKGGN